MAGLAGEIAGEAAGLGDSGEVVSAPPQALKGNKSADAASKASVLVFMVFHQCNDGYRLCSLPVVSVNPLAFNSLLFSICRNYISFSKLLRVTGNIKSPKSISVALSGIGDESKTIFFEVEVNKTRKFFYEYLVMLTEQRFQRTALTQDR
jgi:hypothetical protein